MYWESKVTKFCLCCIAVAVSNTASFLDRILDLWTREVVVHFTECLAIPFGIPPDNTRQVDESHTGIVSLSESIDERVYEVVGKVILGRQFFDEKFPS